MRRPHASVASKSCASRAHADARRSTSISRTSGGANPNTLSGMRPELGVRSGRAAPSFLEPSVNHARAQAWRRWKWKWKWKRWRRIRLSSFPIMPLARANWRALRIALSLAHIRAVLSVLQMTRCSPAARRLLSECKNTYRSSKSIYLGASPLDGTISRSKGGQAREAAEHNAL